MTLLAFCALAYFQAFVLRRCAEQDFEKILALRSAPAPPAIASASRLRIPRIGVSVMIHDGVRPETLRIGAGHIPGTAYPGEEGNVGIAAHRDLFFRDLRKIQKGDTISLDTLGGSYQYEVEWMRVVHPSEVSVLADADSAALTLVTCYPFYYVGPAPDRFIVRARRVE